jgi:circadian clock protein KaiB
MRKQTPEDCSADFEKAIKDAATAPEHYVLRLFITGTTAKSNRAIRNIRGLCEEHLHGRYDLEVVDIYQQPALASGQQIIAAPTLIKRLPEPLRKIVGDLSNVDRVLTGLNVYPGHSEK